MRRKVLSIFLVFLLALPLCIRIRASGLEWTALAELLDAAPDGLLQSNALTPGDSLSDWVAILAGRSGETGGAEAYLEKLWKEVSRRYEQTGGLDAVQATAWHRTALTVMALGADPTCFGTDAQGQAIDLIADGTYAWDTTESLGTQGLNGWIFALITLDAGAYSVPENAGYTRQEILDAILAAQEPDGGSGNQERYASEVEQALAYLSAEQTAQGDFISYGTASAESCAQVVMALCALGVDPRTDDRFVKAGGSALDGLLLYQTAPFAISWETRRTFWPRNRPGWPCAPWGVWRKERGDCMILQIRRFRRMSRSRRDSPTASWQPWLYWGLGS